MIQQEQAQEKALQLIEGLAQTLGVASEHVYGVMTTQMVTEGVVRLVMAPLTFAAFAFCLRKAGPAIAKFNAASYSTEDEYAPAAFGYGACSVIFGVGAAVELFHGIPRAVMKLLNPEFYAINEILKALAGAQ